jgi:MYXO-CTERM domain-containing protein
MLLPLVAVLSTMHYEGDVATTGGDYAEVPFAVPAGTVEIQVTHGDGSDYVILDWGVWGPDGFRGWGGGLTDDAVIGVEQSSRSYLPGPITPGAWTVMIGKAKLDPSTGGHYAIDVVCRDNATLPVLPKAPYAAPVLSTERRWYKGDFHVHSVQSGDANATFDQIATLAKSRGLDFVNLSDHNTVSQHALIAAAQPALPDFLMLRGAEITTYAGHGNAVGLSSYVDHRIGFNGRTINGVLDDVAAQDAIFIVNHPTLDLGGACIGCAWHHDDADWSKVSGIELITGNWDIAVYAFTPAAIAMWDAQLNNGHRIAAIGGSDDHTAGVSEGPTGSPIGSPTTLVLADNLSEAAIIDAIRRGRTIVQLRGPDDPLVEVTMRAADGHAAEIGDTLEGLETARLTIHVTAGAGTFAQVWRDGEKIHQVEVTTDDFTTSFEDELSGLAEHRYRVELTNDFNQRVVVTSHIYASGLPLTGFCSCGNSSHGGPGAALMALVVALVIGRRRRATWP